MNFCPKVVISRNFPSAATGRNPKFGPFLRFSEMFCKGLFPLPPEFWQIPFLKRYTNISLFKKEHWYAWVFSPFSGFGFRKKTENIQKVPRSEVAFFPNHDLCHFPVWLFSPNRDFLDPKNTIFQNPKRLACFLYIYIVNEFFFTKKCIF